MNKTNKNQFFIEIICNLDKKNAAKLCGINSSEITKWYNGGEIPSGYMRLMKMNRRLELSHHEEWNGFKIESGRLILPTGARLTAAQVLTGSALIEIEDRNDIRTLSKLVKIARAIVNVREKIKALN